MTNLPCDNRATNATEYARQMMMPKATVLRYFTAHNISVLTDIKKAFPRDGHVAEDMQASITKWVLEG